MNADTAKKRRLIDYINGTSSTQPLDANYYWGGSFYPQQNFMSTDAFSQSLQNTISTGNSGVGLQGANLTEGEEKGGLFSKIFGKTESGKLPWSMVAGMAGDLTSTLLPSENLSEVSQVKDATTSNFNFGADYSADQAESIAKDRDLMKIGESLPGIGGFFKLGNSVREGVVNRFGGLDTKGGAITNAVLNPVSSIKSLFKGENPFKPIEYTDEDKKLDWAKARNPEMLSQQRSEAAYLPNGSTLEDDKNIQNVQAGFRHEVDPQGGINLGTVGSNGKPNIAEKAEVVVKLPTKGEFVFSDRLKF
jgi:hypothetical protein